MPSWLGNWWQAKTDLQEFNGETEDKENPSETFSWNSALIRNLKWICSLKLGLKVLVGGCKTRGLVTEVPSGVQPSWWRAPVLRTGHNCILPPGSTSAHCLVDWRCQWKSSAPKHLVDPQRCKLIQYFYGSFNACYVIIQTILIMFYCSAQANSDKNMCISCNLSKK